jgi:hypothetical protein
MMRNLLSLRVKSVKSSKKPSFSVSPEIGSSGLHNRKKQMMMKREIDLTEKEEAEEMATSSYWKQAKSMKFLFIREIAFPSASRFVTLKITSLRS